MPDMNVMTCEEATQLFTADKVYTVLPSEQGRIVIPVGEMEDAVSLDRKGKLVKGCTFYNPTDGSVQVLRSDTGVVVCYDAPGLQEKLNQYFAEHPDAFKTEANREETFKFLRENAINPATGKPDFYDSDINWASKLKGAPEEMKSAKAFVGHKLQAEMEAIRVKPGTKFQGPTGSPQIAGRNGAYIVKSGDSMHMIQSDAFSGAYKVVSKPLTKFAQIRSALNKSRMGVAVNRLNTKTGRSALKVIGTSGKVAGTACRVLGPATTVLLLCDGKWNSKLVSGDVLGAGKDMAMGLYSLGKAGLGSVGLGGQGCKEEYEALKEMGKHLINMPWDKTSKALYDGFKMTGESLLVSSGIMDLMSDKEVSQGHVDKPVFSNRAIQSGLLTIQDGKIQTEEQFFMAFRDKGNPNRIDISRRAGSDMTPCASFVLDNEGRVVSKETYREEIRPCEIEGEKYIVRANSKTTQYYDSSAETSLKNEFGVSFDGKIGRKTKEVTEINYQNCVDNVDYGLNENNEPVVVCKTLTRSITTKQPHYDKNGIMTNCDIKTTNDYTTDTYPLTEKEAKQLAAVQGKSLEEQYNTIIGILETKDETHEKNPEKRICKSETSQEELVSKEHYAPTRQMAEVKNPTAAFVNENGLYCNKVEDLTHKIVYQYDPKQGTYTQVDGSQNAGLAKQQTSPKNILAQNGNVITSRTPEDNSMDGQLPKGKNR